MISSIISMDVKSKLRVEPYTNLLMEMKMHKSFDTQKDTEDNEIEPDRISNSDATQVLTIENKEVSLEERKSHTFIDPEYDSSTPAGKCF